MDTGVNTNLRSKIDSLLRCEHDKIFSHVKRMPTISYGLFLLGRDQLDAKPTIVISCNNKEVCKQIKGVLKKKFVISDFSKLKLTATTVFPRSSVSLERLCRDSDVSSHSEKTSPNRLWNHQPLMQHVCPVFVDKRISHSSQVLLPATVWMGLPNYGLKTLIGGLIYTVHGRKNYGLTVAHTLPNPESLDIKEAEATQGSFTKIGNVVLSSNDPISSGLDWALVQFEPDITVCTLAPYPLNLASPLLNGRSRDILIKTDRGLSDLTTGIISPRPHYISVNGDGSFIETWTVLLDRTIGKCQCIPSLKNHICSPLTMLQDLVTLEPGW